MIKYGHYEQKIYKIRDKDTGLFSTGGCRPDFNKEGKTWMSIGHMKNHLHQFIHFDYMKNLRENRIPEEWEVVEYKRTEIELVSIKAKPLIEV